jgi:hypothetical protein
MYTMDMSQAQRRTRSFKQVVLGFTLPGKTLSERKLDHSLLRDEDRKEREWGFNSSWHAWTVSVYLWHSDGLQTGSEQDLW